MKKSGKFNYLLLIGVLISAFTIIFLYTSSSNITGNAIYTPPASLKDCSDENIISIWSSIFKEGSDEIIINKTCSNDNKTYSFKAYKIEEGRGLYIIAGWKNIENLLNTTSISGRYINYNQNYLNSTIVEAMDNMVLLINMDPGNTNNFTNITSRNIIDPDQAKSEYNSYFKISTSGLIDSGQTILSFLNYSLWMNNTEGSYVYANYSINEFHYTLREELLANCTPNWTRLSMGCQSNELKIISYTDSNTCGTNISKPADSIEFCDYDSNGIIGNASHLNVENVSILIASLSLNNSLNYSNNSAQQLVEIKQNNATLISFNHNFTISPLNLKNMTIKTNDANSTYGYIIINGLSDSKTVFLEQKNSSTNQVCIKDAEITNISNIDSECEEEDEYLISCPGNSNGFSCNISNNMFTITNLRHSAAREISLINCIPNWTCAEFSNCINYLKTRTCVDTNNCNTITGRPTINESCLPEIICSPDWTCSNWSDCDDSQQTRVCTDKNNCNKTADKPEETQECTKKSFLPWILICAAIIILAIMILLIVSLLSNGKQNSTQSPPTPPLPPSRPTQQQNPTQLIPQPIPNYSKPTYVPTQQSIQQNLKNIPTQNNSNINNNTPN